jgi:ribosomal protein S18 acetylase RimI-like enzyme
MEEVRFRQMKPEEFDGFRARSIGHLASEQIAAGNWTAETAQNRAARQTDRLLPDGLNTVGARLLVAETSSGEAIGTVWIAIELEDDGRAWIYDIEIAPHQRRRGYGRALLRAAERDAALRGCGSIGLNVFSENHAARQLYASSGYEVTSLRLHKPLAQP